jgi:glutathione S-transferase
MNWVAAVALLAVLQSMAFSFMVGYARGKYKVPAPAVAGNEVFERHFRVHYNTNELLIVFLPALWLFGLYISPRWAAILGGVYLLGRIVYAIGYVRAPTKREIGFGLSFLPIAVLLLGALIGVGRSLLF